MPANEDVDVTHDIKQRKPRSAIRKALYVAGGCFMLVAIIGGVLLRFYPNTVIHYVVEPKLKKLIADRLGQRYSLEMKSIVLSRNRDSLILTGVRIVDNGRTAQGGTDSSAHSFGMELPLDRLTTDTVLISGLHYWKLILQRGLFADMISIRSPTIYLRPGTLPKFSANTKLLPGFLPAVSSKYISVENAKVYLSEDAPSPGSPSDPSSIPRTGVMVRKASLEFRDFFLDEPTYKNASSTFFCKGATFHAEDVSQIDSLRTTRIHIAAVDGDLIDSSMTVQTIVSTRPIEEVRNVIVERVTIAGLDWFSVLAGRGLQCRHLAISKPQLFLQDVANISPHPARHIAASDLIPLPTLLPDVAVDEVEISNAEVYALLPGTRSVSELKHIRLMLEQFKLDSTTPFTNISSFFSSTANYGISQTITISTAFGALQFGTVSGTGKSVSVSNIRLNPSSKGLALVTVKAIEVGGLDIWKLLMRDGIFSTSIRVQQPSLYLDRTFSVPMTCLDSILMSDPLAAMRGYKQYPLPALLPEVHIGSIVISGGSVSGIHYFDDPTNPRSSGDSIQGLQLSLTDFNLDHNSWTRGRGMLFSNTANFSISPVTQHTQAGMYQYRVGSVTGDLRRRTLTVDSIRMRPLITEDSFGNAFPFRTARVDLIAPKLSMSGVNYQKLLMGSGLFADRIIAKDWKLNIYNDRRHPEAPRKTIERYPQELFQLVRMPVGIKQTLLNDGRISYRESWPDTNTPGTIILTRVNARVTNISTDRGFGDTATTKIDGNLMIMNAGLITFRLDYQLLNPHLFVDVQGTVGPMDASLFNEYLTYSEPFTLTGNVHSAIFDFSLRDSLMTGTIAPQYDSLHVKFFRWDRFPPGFVSFFANTIFMRSHNTPELDNPLATARISAILDPNANMFWALWHPIRSGIGSIIRIPEWVW